MKKFLITSLCIICIAAVLGVGALALSSREITLIEDLGVPYLEIYGEDRLSSRLAEDLTVHGGRLYVGGGDYDKNTGPVYVLSYDLENGGWECSDEPIDDEQIKRFEIINGELVILGTDPKEDWSLGNYYVLRDGTWETVREIPNGVHCYDYEKFNGAGFFGLGVDPGHSPIVRCIGDYYTPVELFREGYAIDTSLLSTVRVYNLFTYQNELYAFFTFDRTSDDGVKAHYMDLYKYNGSTFEFVAGTLLSEDMPEVATSDSAAYFILNDNLLTTENIINFSAIGLTQGAVVTDLIDDDGIVYVLAWRETGENDREIMIFEHGEEGFTKKISFFSDSVAGSFCKDGNSFYISLGDRESLSPANDVGRVIRVSITNKLMLILDKFL